MDNLLKYDLVLAKTENISPHYINSFFMVKPQHPFIKYCIEQLPNYVDSFIYLGKHIHIYNSTGTFFLTKMLYNYKAVPNSYLHNSYVLTQNEFAGDCNACNQIKCKGGTYFKHISGKSWHSLDSTIYDLLLCNYKKILILVVLIILYKFSGKGSKKFKFKFIKIKNKK